MTENDKKIFYAPIIIPTLNRKKHLEKCINSLSDNGYACYTDLYISVDFPPSEKFNKGYNEVCDFLKKNSSKIKKKFKTLNIFYQKKNLGPYYNKKFLFDIIFSKFDTYIFLEDDVVVSQNFIEYLDKCLLFFKNDEKVLNICAHKDCDYIYNSNNVTAVKMLPAYGFAGWFFKDDIVLSNINTVLVDNGNKIFKNNVKQLKKYKSILNLYIDSIFLNYKKPFWQNNKLDLIDSVRTVYMYITNCYCIVPEKNKSITIGNDGSGCNMRKEKISKYNFIDTIDGDKTFNLSINGNYFINDNYFISDEYLNLNTITKLIKIGMKMFLYMICRFNRVNYIFLLKMVNNEKE